MKHVLNLLLLSTLFLALNTSTKAKTTVEDDYIYTIHIGTFVKVKMSDFSKVHQFGFIYAEKFDDKLMHIYMGDYVSFGKAKKILSDIKANGFPDAYVTSRKLSTGQEATLIQLGVSRVGDPINWAAYARAGQLYFVIENDQIKIQCGPFDDTEGARERLSLLKKNGFSDAFIKKINDVKIHPISSFEAGDLSEVLVIEEGQEKESERPKEYSDVSEDLMVSRSVEEAPTSYSDVGEKTISNSTPEPKTIASPNIRKNVKRTSVFELQKALKAESTYQGPLDGLYGNGTSKGYQTALEDISQLKQYRLLAKHMVMPVSNQQVDKLQISINTLIDNVVVGMEGLRSSNEAIAKAYLAYILFRQEGASQEVDDLMNNAIKQAFKGNKKTNSTPFDYKATYSYKDYSQLILHLRHVQSASTNEYAAPCWLFQQHPEEAISAYEPNPTMSSDDYLIQDCNQQLNWEELQLLKMIAADMDPDIKSQPDASIMAKIDAKRTRLLMAPKPLSADDIKHIKTWNSDLWNGLNEWCKSDPLHKKWCTSLKVAYYQSQVRLEDYFMNKGFESREATGLALTTLKTMVDHHLSSYMQ